MNVNIKPLLEWAASRPRNEQLLLVLGAAVVVAYLLVQAIGAPLAHMHSLALKSLPEQESTLSAIKAKLAQSTPEDMAQLKQERANKIAALRAQQSEHETVLGTLHSGVVQAGEMSQLLAALMEATPGVRVTDVQTLPAVAINPEPAAALPTAIATTPAPPPGNASSAETTPAASVSPPSGDMYYKLPLRLHISGRYKAVARYVAALEKLPWKVFWVAMALEVQEGPEVNTTLELFTISKEATWFAAS